MERKIEASEQSRRKAINSHDEQMLDAQSQCVPCKLCGGKAVISDAGPGYGYNINCENAGWMGKPKCLQSGARISGWAYNVSDRWNSLNATQPDPAVLAALPEVQALIAAAYEVRPALTAPRDGTLVRLLLDYSDEENWVPLEDKIQAWTIGYNTLADAGDDEWIIVGWDWSQDCWCEGSGKIIGWLPFVPQAPAHATAALAARDAAMIARGMREAATLLREQGYGTAPKQILARAAEIEGDGK